MSERRMTRRKVLAMGTGTTLATTLAGCSAILGGNGSGNGGDGGGDGGDGGGNGGDGSGTATDVGGDTTTQTEEDTQSGPVKIGHLNHFAGPASSLGKQSKAAINVAIDRINNNGGLAGRQLEVEHVNSAGTALSAYNRFVEKGKDFIIGPLGSSSALQVAPRIAESGIITMPLGRTSTLFEEVSDATYLFRIDNSTIPLAVSAARETLNRAGPNPTVAGINPDYSYGRTLMSQYKTALKRLGGNVEVVFEGYPEFLSGQFSSHISSINSKQPDVTFTSLWAGDAVAFMRQANAQGMFENTTLLNTSIIDSSPNFDNSLIKDKPIVSYSENYVWNWPSFDYWPLGGEFLTDMRDQGIQFPVVNAMIGYESVAAWATAVEKVHKLTGSWPSQDQISTALEGHGFLSPAGYNTIGHDHQNYRASYWGDLVPSDQAAATLDNVTGYSPKMITPPPGMKASDYLGNLM